MHSRLIDKTLARSADVRGQSVRNVPLSDGDQTGWPIRSPGHVVRLAGTNVEEGKAIIQNSGLPLISANTLAEAAAAAVSARPKAAA